MWTGGLESGGLPTASHPAVNTITARQALVSTEIGQKSLHNHRQQQTQRSCANPRSDAAGKGVGWAVERAQAAREALTMPGFCSAHSPHRCPIRTTAFWYLPKHFCTHALCGTDAVSARSHVQHIQRHNQWCQFGIKSMMVIALEVSLNQETLCSDIARGTGGHTSFSVRERREKSLAQALKHFWVSMLNCMMYSSI